MKELIVSWIKCTGMMRILIIWVEGQQKIVSHVMHICKVQVLSDHSSRKKNWGQWLVLPQSWKERKNELKCQNLIEWWIFNKQVLVPWLNRACAHNRIEWFCKLFERDMTRFALLEESKRIWDKKVLCTECFETSFWSVSLNRSIGPRQDQVIVGQKCDVIRIWPTQPFGPNFDVVTKTGNTCDPKLQALLWLRFYSYAP